MPASANFSKQKVSIPQLTIKEAGYLFTYLSYENASNNYVYFDDFKVTHTPTNIIQSNEYYPFGMQTAGSWTREGNNNRFLYNSASESNTVTGVYDLTYRSFDPALARMNQVDPMADKYGSVSVYNYALNNPVSINDPNGADAHVTMYDYIQAQWAANYYIPFNAMVAGEPGGGTGGSNNYRGGTLTTSTYLVETYVWTNNGARELVSSYLEKEYSYQRNEKQFDFLHQEFLNFSSQILDQTEGGCWWCADSQGKFLFKHWQNGNGRELFLNNEEWGNYMRGADYLSYIIGLEMDKRYSGSSGGTIIGRMHGETGVNGYFTGLGMLNGSNADVGDLEYSGVAIPGANGTMIYNLTMTFHDIMDPNFNYYGDEVGAKIYPGKPYNVHITWSLSITISPPSTAKQSTRY